MKKNGILGGLILIFSALFSLKAQIYSNPNPGTYGFRFNRASFVNALLIPTSNSAPNSSTSLNSAVTNQAAIAFDSTGHNLYVWDPSLKTWKSTIGEPVISAGATSQYWRGDKTWQTLPNYTLSGLGGVPTSRTITINGTALDLSADRSWSINSMIYPSAGIAVSTGAAWGISITDNSSNWNNAFTDRFKWDGGASGLNAFTGRSSLGLGTAATANTGDFATASHSHSFATTSTNGFLSSTDWNTFNNKQNALGFTPYNSTNPSGYISGISGAMVTSALGYTPYNSTNPSGYITSSGSISGNAATATNVAWTGVTGRPTALSSFTNDLGNYGGWITSSGRAYPRRSDGGDLNFYWSGQSGQPTWLWGGSDGTNMYVYNPSNFSVNYATSAGSAGSVSWGNVSGRPSALSQFSNDLGNYGGWITSSGKADGAMKLWAQSHPNDYYIVNNWTGAYWQLTSNHGAGVQVAYANSSGSAASASSVAWSNVSGRPTAVSSFSNDAGYITGSYLPLSGGTMSGSLTINGGNIAISGEIYAGQYFKAGAGANEPYLWNPYGGDHWRATASAWYTYIGVGSTNFFSTSLRSSKTNITPFTRSALDIINGVNVVEFNYKTDLENKRIGFIADDTVQELATKNHNQMDINSTIGVLIKAVQEQQALIIDLKAQVEALKNGI